MARAATHPVKKVVGFDPELLERMRNYRFDQRIATENEAIRRLIAAGLGKAKAPSSSPPGGRAEHTASARAPLNVNEAETK
jgi:hypothetical protein